MRLIQQQRLFFREGNSDKVYEVDLCEAGEGEYLVNFRYGRRGATLREGTKTTFPESLEKAQKIFDSLVNSKLNKGYRSAGEAGEEEPPQPAAEPAAASEVPTDPGKPAQRAATLKRLREAAANPASAKSWRLSRIIWRVGELRIAKALPSLAELARQESDPMTCYSIAWAVGKLGDPMGATIASTLLSTPGLDAASARMATEASLALLPEAKRDKFVEGLKRSLPEAIKNALESGDASSLRRALDEHLERAAPPHDCIDLLYQIGARDPLAREAVHELCRTLPLKPPFFRHIRHVFKAAEFRNDSDVFGLLAYRFEKGAAFFCKNYGWWWDPTARKSVKIAKEIGKPDSRIAYSDSTRRYLRGRVVRTLRRAGKLEDPQVFITLAAGVLMAYDDEFDRKEVVAETSYRYNADSRRYEQTQQLYDDYANYAPLNYLLYTNSQRYVSGRSRWRCADGYVPGTSPGPAPDFREEAFPQLWNRAPDALMLLLRHSRCGRVHEFATKVWLANPSFDELADISFIVALFEKPYDSSNALGLHLARSRFDPANPDRALLAAILNVDHDEARAQGIDWLRQTKDIVLPDLEFVRALLVNRHSDVQGVTRDLLASISYSDEQLDMLVPIAIVAALDLDPDDETAPGVARHIRELLIAIAGGRLGKVGFDVAGDLLAHPLEEVQLLGAQILVKHESPIESFTDDVLQKLLSSDFASVRDCGMQIFGRFTDTMLAERKDVLASFCLSAKPDVRSAARPIVERLAKTDPQFAREMVERFYPMLLHKETEEGLHDDIYALLEGPLGAQLDAIPAEYSFRMLDSKYSAAQQLGLLILQRFGDLSAQPMRAIATLGSNELVATRQYIHEFYRSHPERIKADKPDALRIVDSAWDDTRAFAFEYFRETFVEEDWSPSLLVSVCDSIRTDVQDFGRELITRFFKGEDGPEYLLKLSQHPSDRLQLFASNYLARFAADDPDQLEALEPYFVTVLSSVNRGRVAKARSLALLREEGLKDRRCAEIAMRVLTRQSVTIAIGDKAGCIEAILDLAGRWPDLNSPLDRTPFPAFVPD